MLRKLDTVLTVLRSTCLGIRQVCRVLSPRPAKIAEPEATQTAHLSFRPREGLKLQELAPFQSG